MVKHKRWLGYVLFVLAMALFFFGLGVRWGRVEISDGRGGDWKVVRNGLLMPWDKSVGLIDWHRRTGAPEARLTEWCLYGTGRSDIHEIDGELLRAQGL